MTDAELFRIYSQAPTPTAGLRAVFSAGAESVLEIDEISEEELVEILNDGLHNCRPADSADGGLAG